MLCELKYRKMVKITNVPIMPLLKLDLHFYPSFLGYCFDVLLDMIMLILDKSGRKGDVEKKCMYQWQLQKIHSVVLRAYNGLKRWFSAMPGIQWVLKPHCKHCLLYYKSKIAFKIISLENGCNLQENKLIPCKNFYFQSYLKRLQIPS